MTDRRLELQGYVGQDDDEVLVLLSGADVVPASQFTRFRLVFDGGMEEVDSDVTPDAYEWPVDAEDRAGATVEGLRLALGELALAAGQYTARLVGHETDYPNGRTRCWLRITMSE